MAVYLLDGIHCDALSVQRKEDQAHSRMPLGSGLTEQSERPVGKDGATGPYLVAVQHVLVAIVRGRGSNSCQITPRHRLRPRLRPDFLAARHRRQEALLLFFRPKFDQRRPEQENAVLTDPSRSTGTRIFFFEYQPLDEVQPAATIFRRPGHHAPVAGFQHALPIAVRLEAFAAVVEVLQWLGGDVVLQPDMHLKTECFLFGRVFELHQNFAVPFFSTKASRAV